MVTKSSCGNHDYSLNKLGALTNEIYSHPQTLVVPTRTAQGHQFRNTIDPSVLVTNY